MQTTKDLPDVNPKYADKINWYWLSNNPGAVHLLKKNLEKIDWSI